MVMGKIANVVHSLKPVMIMVVSQAALAGINIYYKLGADIGMSLRVMIAYRFLFASAFIVPIALVVERKNRPKLTWKVVGQAFLCGLLGLEKLGRRKMSGKAKVIGTSICISGAMVLTFYKGAELNLWSTSIDLLHNKSGHVAQPKNPILGAFLVVACCFSSATSLIIQAKMLGEYPCPYTSTALMMIMGSIQTVVFALCMERSNWSRWKLGWDLRLLLVSYAGIVGSGLSFTLKALCVQMRGPLFVSVFSPLVLVLVAIAGSLVLNEKLHVGSVMGAGIIVCGLYMVLWGKRKDQKKLIQLRPAENEKKDGKIDIIVTTSTENNKIDRSTTQNDSIQNGIAIMSYGEYFDYEASEENKDEENEEEKRQEGGGLKNRVNDQV